MSILDALSAGQANPAQMTQAAQGGVGQAAGGSMQAFAQALERSQAGAGGASPVEGMQVTNIQHVQYAGEVSATDGVTAAAATPADQAARQRALDGLDLNVDAAGGVAGADGSTGGQSILDGLSRIRGAFDSQLAGVNDKINSATMDVTSMMSVHADVVQYSLLVDVSSKLAGKSTQAVDTLMKGQ